ncbi:unnamed protein product [Trichogramma brassicae]|uniref:Uncharacterized protein n=1 Tax=Trichogramma brassicae TaxID=86971 RepID=A0A6H5I434_9HYME|nr:unnamed protein product [Trichogramma brassicae]
MHWQPCDNHRAITKPFAPRRSRKSDNDDSSRTAHMQQHICGSTVWSSLDDHRSRQNTPARCALSRRAAHRSNRLCTLRSRNASATEPARGLEQGKYAWIPCVKYYFCKQLRFVLWGARKRLKKNPENSNKIWRHRVFELRTTRTRTARTKRGAGRAASPAGKDRRNRQARKRFEESWYATA